MPPNILPTSFTWSFASSEWSLQALPGVLTMPSDTLPTYFLRITTNWQAF
jgi:hypothetical protein